MSGRVHKKHGENDIYYYFLRKSFLNTYTYIVDCTYMYMYIVIQIAFTEQYIHILNEWTDLALDLSALNLTDIMNACDTCTWESV